MVFEAFAEVRNIIKPTIIRNLTYLRIFDHQKLFCLFQPKVFYKFAG